MKREYFGTDKNGNEIYKYTIYDNENNSVSILNYGATIQSLVINGRDVVLGFDTIEEYENDENRTYFGAVCGRVANRVENARFYVEGVEYNLYRNNGKHSLHGGKCGFDKRFFELTNSDDGSLTFSIFSPDGEEGYPGNLSLSVKYTFKNRLLLIEYMAKTTAACPVNITNHSYFNLDGKGDILSHKLQLNSHYYLAVDDDVCANGNVMQVAGTPFDFTGENILGENILAAEKLQPAVGGIDHHFFCDSSLTEYRKFGTLTSSDDKLKMDIFTNQCGAQIYTGNFIKEMTAKGTNIGRFGGIAIETQLPPNNLNHSHLPNMMLKRDETYYHKTGYKFYY